MDRFVGTGRRSEPGYPHPNLYPALSAIDFGCHWEEFCYLVGRGTMEEPNEMLIAAAREADRSGFPYSFAGRVFGGRAIHSTIRCGAQAIGDLPWRDPAHCFYLHPTLVGTLHGPLLYCGYSEWDGTGFSEHGGVTLKTPVRQRGPHMIFHGRALDGTPFATLVPTEAKAADVIAVSEATEGAFCEAMLPGLVARLAMAAVSLPITPAVGVLLEMSAAGEPGSHFTLQVGSLGRVKWD